MTLSLRSFRTAATLVAITAFAACSSKKDDPAAPPAPGVTWTVDGNNITATNIQRSNSGNNFEFAGSYTTSTSSSVGVDITLPKAVGTYAVPGSGATAVQAIYVAITPGGAAGYIGTAGTVTVTSVTATNIIGTFSFTGTDSFNGNSTTKTITNGKFNVTL